MPATQMASQREKDGVVVELLQLCQKNVRALCGACHCKRCRIALLCNMSSRIRSNNIHQALHLHLSFGGCCIR